MKKFLPILSILLLVPSLSFAASYPASCPAEARAIVDAVGGCSTIDPGQYSSIYGKCCSVNPTYNPQTSPEPTLEEPPVYTPELDTYDASDTSDTSSVYLYLIIPALFWGGLIYLVVWFVRRRKKKKGGA